MSKQQSVQAVLVLGTRHLPAEVLWLRDGNIVSLLTGNGQHIQDDLLSNATFFMLSGHHCNF